MLLNALWLLVLSQSSATLSLDCRLPHGRWATVEPSPAWPAIWRSISSCSLTGPPASRARINAAMGDYSAFTTSCKFHPGSAGMSWLASSTLTHATGDTCCGRTPLPAALGAVVSHTPEPRPAAALLNWINFVDSTCYGLAFHVASWC